MSNKEILKRQQTIDLLAELADAIRECEAQYNREEIRRGGILVQKLKTHLDVRYGANPNATPEEREELEKKGKEQRERDREIRNLEQVIKSKKRYNAKHFNI